MLAACGILPRRDLTAIERALRASAAEIERGRFKWSLEAEDVHFNIERRLTALVGEAASACIPRARAMTRWHRSALVAARRDRRIRELVAA